MSVNLGFDVTFHSAFRVGAAYPRDGIDADVDYADPLPADHLKGLMRAEARRLARAELVGRVFGTTADESPWLWSSARPQNEWTPAQSRHRVKIDSVTHSAIQDHLVTSTATWADGATFTVEQVAPLSEDQLPEHVALLRTSARAIHHLGAWRRRGLGWVGVVPAEEVGALLADLAALEPALTGSERSA